MNKDEGITPSNVLAIALVGVGALGVIYILKTRNKAEELQKVLEEQEALLATTKAKVKAIGIEMQNADYPMSEEVAAGIIRDLASIEGDLTKAQKLNREAQNLGSQEDFMDEFTDAIMSALHDVGIFLVKPTVVILVGIGIAKGAVYFGPKLMKSIIEWIMNSRGGPPPPWTCDGCGLQFGTEVDLEAHVESQHPSNPDDNAILEAQVRFSTLSSTTQLAVAAESRVYERSGWNWLSLPDWNLQSLSWGSMALDNVGAATTAEVVILRTISTLLLAL